MKTLNTPGYLLLSFCCLAPACMLIIYFYHESKRINLELEIATKIIDQKDQILAQYCANKVVKVRGFKN